MDKKRTQRPARGPSDATLRKLQAAERLRQNKLRTPDTRSPVQTAATARKLQRAQGMPEVSAEHSGINERRALERRERANRRRAGTSPLREALIRIGLGDVDTATLLIVGFSALTMLVIPLAFIVTS